MSAAETLDLALALHANPQRAVELRARPLPVQGIANLLRIALGQPEALQEASRATDLPPELLIDAARFFVEQQMLLQECEHDPWRVLGAQPGAPESQLREHQRLLVSLVHPDRSSDWPGAFADRVNKAWRALRSAEGRAQHDSGQLAELPSLPVVTAPAIFRPGFVAPAVHGPVHSAPHRFRHLPAMLVGAIVLVAGGVLLLDDWVREQYGQSSAPLNVASPATDSDPSVANQGMLQRELAGSAAPPSAFLRAAPEPQSEPGVALGLTAFFSYLGSHWSLHQAASVDDVEMAAAAPAPRQPVEIAEIAAVAPPPPARHVPSLVAPPPRVSQPAPARAIAVSRREAPAREAPVPEAPVRQAPVAVAVAVADPGPPKMQVAMLSPDPPAPAPAEEIVAPVAAPVAMAMVDTVDTAQIGHERQVRAVLDRFGVHFQQGDLMGLLDLFALNANPEHGGVPGLAARYSQVFENTRSRSVRFDGIHWIEERGHIRGAANVEITTHAAGRSRRELRSGRVEFEVLLDGDRALIQRWVPSGEAGEA